MYNLMTHLLFTIIWYQIIHIAIGLYQSPCWCVGDCRLVYMAVAGDCRLVYMDVAGD